jgi:outer membrane immunogenic protein
MKRPFLAAVILASCVVSASAADMTVKAASVAPAYNWTGFYAGINAGYTWGNDNSVRSIGSPGPCDPIAGGGCTATPNYSTLSAIGSTFNLPANLDGFIGGGQIGYNWQFNRSVAGLEADIQGIGRHGASSLLATVVPSPAFPANPLTLTATVSRSIDYIGTVRGRVGWLATPSVLLYGTGGLAYGKVNVSSNINVAQSCGPGCFFLTPPASFGSSSVTRAGWVVGAGVEWMFAPHWTARAEYLYYDLGNVTASSTLVGLNGIGVVGALFMTSFAQATNRFDGSIARVGVNYTFGGPVVAKY